MSLLFETIRIVDGIIQNADLHIERINRSRAELKLSTEQITNLDFIEIPEIYRQGLVKCRFSYDKQFDTPTFEFYTARTINTLQLVNADDIRYDYKFTDREAILNLKHKNAHADEILIIKHGFVTDTSFSNIVLYNGTKWITPSNPLLPGTMRNYLLKNKKISDAFIRTSDLQHYKRIMLINAMLPPDMGSSIAISQLLPEIA